MLKPGQEDEATPDPDGEQWAPERAEAGDDADTSPDDACEPEGGEACELEDDEAAE